MTSLTSTDKQRLSLDASGCWTDKHDSANLMKRRLVNARAIHTAPKTETRQLPMWGIEGGKKKLHVSHFETDTCQSNVTVFTIKFCQSKPKTNPESAIIWFSRLHLLQIAFKRAEVASDQDDLKKSRSSIKCELQFYSYWLNSNAIKMWRLSVWNPDWALCLCGFGPSTLASSPTLHQHACETNWEL